MVATNRSAQPTPSPPSGIIITASLKDLSLQYRPHFLVHSSTSKQYEVGDAGPKNTHELEIII